MKLAYVVKRYPRFSETFIVNEILAHEKAGLEIEIFSLLSSDDSHFQNLISEVRAPVTYLSSKVWKACDLWRRLQSATYGSYQGFATLNDFRDMPVRDVAHGLELSELIRSRGVTQLHAHFASASTSVARLAARLADVPFSFTAHAKDIFHESVDRVELGRKLEDCAAAITVSEFNVNQLRREFKASATKLRRIYNGLDLKKFKFEAKPATSRQILAVGRLVEKKGFADLINACGLLNDRGVDFHCTIVGTGELEGPLRTQVMASGLGSVVELTGALPQSRVKQLIRSAAVFAAPCIVGRDGNKDGLPTVLLEAMASGTPCVSTAVTGIPEVLINGDTGILLEPGDVRALAASLENLLGDVQLRSELATNARRKIESQFDIERNAHELRNLFHEIAVQHQSLGVAS